VIVVALACAALVGATTVLHYEALRLLTYGLPRIGVPARAKLLVVMFATFVSHGLNIVLYGLAYWLLANGQGFGHLVGGDAPRAAAYLYFSAETYTSLGFGDVVPVGPLRMLAGIETLNGLLLIGWSASYTYLAMERFWNEG